jgi:hypothetical protein
VQIKPRIFGLMIMVKSLVLAVNRNAKIPDLSSLGNLVTSLAPNEKVSNLLHRHNPTLF